MMALQPQLLAGIWQCNRCRHKYRMKHTPGVLEQNPTSMPPRECRCGGQINACTKAALRTESEIKVFREQSLVVLFGDVEEPE